MAKQPSPLSESDIRWLQAERALIGREISLLHEKHEHLTKLLAAAGEKLAAHDTRLAVLEKPQPAKSAAATHPDPWEAVKTAAALHIWKVGIGLALVSGYRLAAGRWPQQEFLSGILKAIF